MLQLQRCATFDPFSISNMHWYVQLTSTKNFVFRIKSSFSHSIHSALPPFMERPLPMSSCLEKVFRHMTDKKSKHFHKRTPSSFHAPTWLGPSCIYSQVWKALSTSWMLNNGEICLKRWDKLCTSIAVKGQGRVWVGEGSLHWCKSERARSYVWCLNKYYRY